MINMIYKNFFMKSYYIITIGCQMNKSDSERIAGYLEKLGYRKIDNRKQADLVVVTTCGVRQSAEDRIYGLIPEIKKENSQCKIILTGCLVEREDVRQRLGKWVDIWLPIGKISNFKFQISNKIPISKSEYNSCDYLSIKPQYDSNISAFVPIGNGCDNFCTYCVVPYARGREVYRPATEIIDEVKKLIKNNYKEINLIAQNVNSFKSKIKNQKSLDFSDLLKTINDIPGDFWIRFQTSHPKDMSDKLIKTIAQCEKVCRQIHLPVQAGDNGILAKMNRKYTVNHYIELINKIRKTLNFNTNPKSKIQNPKLKRLPVAITTDVIVGFPGETRIQFNNTKKLFKEVNFDMAYIAQYSPRPGTAAEKMKDNVSKAEKMRREIEVNDILRKTGLENNQEYINKTVRVLVDSNKKNTYFGKTNTGKDVRFTILDAKNLAGKFVDVKITSVQNFSMEGELIK
jgi:tRNA-2-methylthio-N6-dimethylallyladenosine synthase